MYILSSDFDGTLFVNGEISEKDRNAINKFRAQGNLFIINTGRSLPDIFHQFDLQNLEADYYIGSNGSMVADKNRKTIYKSEFSTELSKEIYGFFKNKLSEEVFFIAIDSENSTGVEFYDKDFVFFKDRYTNIEEAFTNNIITMFSQARDKENTSKIIEKLNIEFGNRAIFNNTAPYIDITESLNNKATGLNIVKQIESENLIDIYTIGDELNDISMLTEFNGFTMSHANYYMKAQINQSIESVGELINTILR
ncbi:HAD-IIB family hydrolase [Helcococcus kunzii]|uniref:HAD-IIB family hydrolase n=1 Tax=Helcococcus kunzii TaxID=40091 RepID=UPI0038AFFD0C